MGLYYSGGNFQPGPDGTGFITSLVQQDNADLSVQQIADLYRTYQGIETLNLFPRLPSSVDGTGHIDMWMYLVDEDTVIISEFLPGSNATAIQITNNAVPYMQNLGFTVYRTPAWNSGFTHYTYSNAFRVNDRIFVPIYGPGNASYSDEDADALAVWEDAAGPSVEIVPIDCYDIIPAAGAIHCIVMQVPRYTQSQPSAHVISPAGGEVVAFGQTQDIAWSATDDGSVSSVDLHYSTDGGLTFPNEIATGLADSGHFTWTVPSALASNEARVRVTAHDDASNTAQAASTADFRIVDGIRHVHDFSTGGGIDKWGWGYQTSTWSQVDGSGTGRGLDAHRVARRGRVHGARHVERDRRRQRSRALPLVRSRVELRVHARVRVPDRRARRAHARRRGAVGGLRRRVSAGGALRLGRRGAELVRRAREHGSERLPRELGGKRRRTSLGAPHAGPPPLHRRRRAADAARVRRALAAGDVLRLRGGDDHVAPRSPDAARARCLARCRAQRHLAVARLERPSPRPDRARNNRQLFGCMCSRTALLCNPMVAHR
jgi:hypothetical protein